MTQNAIPPKADDGADDGADVAARIARRTLSRRGDAYAGEVRRLLDAALEEMRRRGTTSRPRVADIVASAGLSNDAFYRHFRSKDALVTALLEDGTDRLTAYLTHQMAKETTPAGRLRCWVEGILGQAHPDIAETTLVVLWNGGGLGDGSAAGRHFASTPLAQLLHDPLAALGSPTPEVDATLVAHAVLGTLSDHLWQRTQPPKPEVERIIAFCIAAAGSTGTDGS